MTEPPRKRTVRLEESAPLAPEVQRLKFRLPDGDLLRFDPGQFVTFYVPKNGATITRSYSISSSAELHDRFELCVKRVDGGYVSTYLCGLSSGTELRAVGPLGRFLLRDPGGRSVALVCTGTGVAPFVPMSEELLKREPPVPAWLFFGTRTESELLFRSDFEASARVHPNFHYVPVLSRADPGWTGPTGHVEGPLAQQFPSLSDVDVYICGVPGMVSEVQELALRLGCPKDHVFVERY